MSEPTRVSSPTTSRRSFLKTSSAAVVGGSLLGSLGPARMVHASDDETLKIGLVGCGGRGKGAVLNAADADPNVKLVAMCDVFADRLEIAKKPLQDRLGDRFAVDDDHCFSDFDGYKRLLETDIDVVFLCTTPHFRPEQFKASVEAGKHIFCEKPVAVDAPGVRSVWESSNLAQEKNLNVVSGLCWRYDAGVNEMMQRIFDGAIGEIRAINENYLTGGLWHRGNNEEWSQMEYQMRNWMYFTWLSGDHIVEQHIHSLDKALWLMGDKPPVNCFGLGGRQVRVDEQWGHIYDHFAVCYEWDNGVKTFAYTRQMPGCFSEVDDHVIGSDGIAHILKGVIDNGKDEPKPERNKTSMYVAEHQRLFEAIRNGSVINNGEYMCYSTLMAIMGREACYTGKRITWDEIWNSDERLGPTEYEWGDIAIPSVAMPG